MKIKILIMISFAQILATLFNFAYSKGKEYDPFVIYYSDKVSIDELLPYKLLVLDSVYHPPIKPLLDRKKTVLGYISLGEIPKDKDYFKIMEKENAILQENKNWSGSFYVDVRNKNWPKIVLEELIPQIIRKGFSGIFIDTLDNTAHLEEIDHVKYKDMIQAGVNLIKAIRLHYPDLLIMLNRAYDTLPFVVNDIDMILAESIYTDYNFETKENSYKDEDIYKAQVKMLKESQEINPNLLVFTLDYWKEQDKENIKQIYKQHRKTGFVPYVATIDLHKIIKEP